MKNHLKKIILGIAGLSLAGVIVSNQLVEPTQEFVAISWEKPSTDGQWAEDVKKENFDIKSTGVLETMIESHTAKLQREEKEFEKYQNCLDCIRWEFRESLSQMMSGAELDAEVEKQAQEAYNNRLRSVEKLRQSVERMEKEVELRQKGFVIVEGESLNLGASVPANRIRKIND